jgi:uncharacterized repeat protein (TIGR01451 family)
LLTVIASTLSGNSATDGGGIFNQGTLTVTASALNGNSAASGGRSSGGGIANSGTLTVAASTFSGNSAASTISFGGAIANGGTLTVTASTFRGNSATGFPAFGGGISNSGTLTVTNSTLSGNSADGFTSFGGGISNSGTLTVNASTLSGNSADLSGGGINNDGGVLTVTNSTLSGNSAAGGSGSGGGISNRSFISFPIEHIATLTIHTSLFANGPGGNLVESGNPFNRTGTFTSLGHNLFTDTPAVPLDPTDLLNTDPLLAPLGDYGGPTATHALLPGSPAIDAGAAVPGLIADQRGVARPQGPAPDIGAFESRGFVLARLGGDNQRIPTSSPFPDPLVVAVSSPFGEPVARGLVTFFAPAAGASADLVGNSATVGASGQAGVTAAANGFVGTYSVTARTTGAEPLNFTLTNTGTTTNLAVAVAASPAPATVGQPLTYTVTVTNNGPGPATGVVLHDTLPAGVTFVSSSLGGLDPATGQVVAGLGPLAAGTSTTVTIIVRPTTAGTIRNTVDVTANEPDPDPTDNRALVTATGVNPIPLSGPAVVSLQRFGFHARPTRIVLSFSTLLDPIPAGRLGNYRLAAPGRDQLFGTRDDHPLRLRSVAVGPDARTVTLTPGPRLGLRGRRFLLSVNGTAPGGLTDQVGNLLDGDRDGRPGGVFVTTFGAEAFVPPAPLRVPRTVAFNRSIARSRVPAGVFVMGTGGTGTTR